MITGTKLGCYASASMLALCLTATGAEAQSAQSTVPQPETQTQRSTPSSASAEAPTGDIIVTASKRDEKLRDVPSAITVFSGDELANLGVQSVRDYATLTPGLTVQDTGAPGYGKIFIRGLTTGALQQSATTVYYIDDVPFTASSANGGGAYVAPDPELVDIDRIEVLKGPQGTLYGASSLGGVIRLITKKPDSTRLSGNAREEMTAVDGGGLGASFSAALNVPLVADRLAVRASAFYRDAPGYVDNLGTGKDNVNSSIAKGARVAIGWTPSDRLSIDLVGQLQNTDTKGLALEDDVASTFTPLTGARTYTSFFNAPTEVRYRLASITGKYDVGLGQFTATGAYLESRLHYELDATPSYQAYLSLFQLLGYDYPANTGVAVVSTIPMKKKTAELRFASRRLGPVEFMVGGFYTDENSILPTDVVARDKTTNTELPGVLGNVLSAPITDRYEEISGFGNVTVYLANNLDVTGGMRYAHHKEDFSLEYDGVFANVQFGGPVTIPPTHARDDKATYLATVRWRPTSNLSLFARAASGYRPGGPQPAASVPPGAQTVINPDTVWNYEAGFKADLFDNRLSLEASGYHIDWKNIQLYTAYQGLQLLANAGAAQVDGFELQAVGRPTRLLTIAANVGYTDARITKIEPAVTAIIGASVGDPIPDTPHWTTAATIDQLIPLGGNLQGQLGATLRTQSSRFTSFPANTANINARLPAYSTADLRAGILVKNFQFQFRIENLFNKRAMSSYTATAAPTPSIAYLIQPRTFTLSFSAHF